jgi:rhodanese-related sulfurtransferase
MTHAADIPAEDPEAVRSALERGEVVLIDVREPSEYASQRIAGALLFPLSTFDPHKLPVGGRPVILCCGSGKRSRAAFEMCRRVGASVRSHLAGGLGAWIGAGLPVLETAPDTGQLHVVIGSSGQG